MAPAQRQAAVVADRGEPLGRDAGLEQQQAAELGVAVLLDDEVQVVPLQERLHGPVEREAADPHVIERQPDRRQALERLEHGAMAAADRDDAERGAAGAATVPGRSDGRAIARAVPAGGRPTE